MFLIKVRPTPFDFSLTSTPATMHLVVFLGSVPRQVTGGGGRVALRPVVVVPALSPVVVVCLHFETVTLRYSGSSVSVIVEHTIIGKDLCGMDKDITFWLRHSGV